MKRTSIFIVISAATLLVASALAQHKTDYSSFGKDEKDIITLEEQWRDALLTKQAAVLEQILTEDYVVVDPGGQVQTKAQEIAMAQAPEFKLTSFSLGSVRTRLYVGGAVVTGVMVIKGKFADTDVSGEYRFTDVFEPRQNVWKAVARQLTKIKTKDAKDAPAEQK